MAVKLSLFLVASILGLSCAAPRHTVGLADALGILAGTENDIADYIIPKDDDSELDSNDLPVGSVSKVAIETNVALNCRVQVDDQATDAETCALQTQSDGTPGLCRWDVRVSSGACLCPRTFPQCLSKSQCYWQKKSGDDFREGECIHASERFYNLLHKQLMRRGKNSFAIKLAYNAKPAVGILPHGPFGPKVLDLNTPYLQYKNRNNFLQSLAGPLTGLGGHPFGLGPFGQRPFLSANGRYPTFYPNQANSVNFGNNRNQGPQNKQEFGNNQGYGNNQAYNNKNQGYGQNGQGYNNNAPFKQSEPTYHGAQDVLDKNGYPIPQGVPQSDAFQGSSSSQFIPNPSFQGPGQQRSHPGHTYPFQG